VAKTYEKQDEYSYNTQLSEEQVWRRAHKPIWTNAFSDFVEKFVYDQHHCDRLQADLSQFNQEQQSLFND
jgi:hypothetical protein